MVLSIVFCEFNKDRTTHKELVNFLEIYAGRNSVIVLSKTPMFCKGFLELSRNVDKDDYNRAFSVSTYLGIVADNPSLLDQFIWQGVGAPP